MIKALGNLPTRDPHKITYTESEVLQKLIESGKVHYQLSEGWTFKALAEQMEKEFKLQVTERSLQKRYYQWCHDKGIQRAAVQHDEDAATAGQD